jgi:uncharacterized membrane protein YphA (DoxX/SURF4 family)
MQNSPSLSPLQQMALVVLRTLIGWHFLYEGYTKLLQPAWSRAGAPGAAWSSAGYLKAATGPLADVFHSLGNASWIGTLDLFVAALLVAVGLSLMLGFFTQAGCAGALGLLAMFYLSSVPMGSPKPGPRAHTLSSIRTSSRLRQWSCWPRFVPVASLGLILTGRRALPERNGGPHPCLQRTAI